MSHLKTAAVAALSVVLAAPAFGGELEDGLAAIYATAAGSWTGAVNNIDPATGAQTPIPLDFTLVVMGEDGLDYVYWGAAGLTAADYQGDGAVMIRSWSPAGALNQMQTGVIALAEASAPELKAWTMSSTITGPDGNPYDVLSSYSVSDSALTYKQEASLAGADGAPKITIATGSWTRPQ